MKKIGLLLILLLASPAVAQPTFDDLHGSRCSNQRDLLDVLSDQQLLWTEGRGEPGSVLFHVYDITHSSFGDSSITIGWREHFTRDIGTLTFAVKDKGWQSIDPATRAPLTWVRRNQCDHCC